MALTPSTMLELGTPAPDFSLPTAEGETYTLSEKSIDKGLLVLFICNHCPYVIHIREKLAEKIRSYQQQGIEVVAINSNDELAIFNQDELASRCSFDLLQDELEINAWQLLGGQKDDIFIYRKGGRLASFLPIMGDVITYLDTQEGYFNVFQAIVAADQLGPGESCEGGLQISGNMNQDDGLDISDPVFMLGLLFTGGALPRV